MLQNFMADLFTISFLMKMITDRVDTMITRGLALEHVTASQGRVMAYLVSRDGETVSQKDIEQYLGVSHTTAKGIVQRLEQKGWVITAFDNEDGRVKNVYLTDRCRSIHQAIDRQVSLMEDSLLRNIPAEGRQVLRQLLKRMYDNIK